MLIVSINFLNNKHSRKRLEILFQMGQIHSSLHTQWSMGKLYRSAYRNQRLLVVRKSDEEMATTHRRKHRPKPIKSQALNRDRYAHVQHSLTANSLDSLFSTAIQKWALRFGVAMRCTRLLLHIIAIVKQSTTGALNKMEAWYSCKWNMLRGRHRAQPSHTKMVTNDIRCVRIKWMVEYSYGPSWIFVMRRRHYLKRVRFIGDSNMVYVEIWLPQWWAQKTQTLESLLNLISAHFTCIHPSLGGFWHWKKFSEVNVRQNGAIFGIPSCSFNHQHCNLFILVPQSHPELTETLPFALTVFFFSSN